MAIEFIWYFVFLVMMWGGLGIKYFIEGGLFGEWQIENLFLIALSWLLSIGGFFAAILIHFIIKFW